MTVLVAVGEEQERLEMAHFLSLAWHWVRKALTSEARTVCTPEFSYPQNPRDKSLFSIGCPISSVVIATENGPRRLAVGTHLQSQLF